MKNKFLNIVILISLLIIFLISIYVWVYNVTDKHFNKANEVAILLQSERAKHSELEGLKSNINQTLSKKEKLVSVFLNHDQAAEFIQLIESLAKEVGISGKTVSVESNDVSELSILGKEQMEIAFEASGSYSKLMKFVSIIEKLPYKSSINNLSISKNTKISSSKNNSTDVAVPSGWSLKMVLNVVKIKPQ